jgi:SAM-dependent methyltransferase
MARMRTFVEEHLADRRGRPTAILDVGSMDVNGSYRPLFDDPSWTYTGADVEAGDGVDVVLQDAYSWGFPARSFDVVVSGQALEHIAFPWVSMLEIHRVLRPGGLACLVAPASGMEHRYPIDCWRFYTDGMLSLALWADLEPLFATTNWADEQWSDNSNEWHDSVLIARRPVRGPVRGLVGGVKRRLVRLVSGRQAERSARILMRHQPGANPSGHAD